jgi:predicted transcriptional regulator
MFSKTELKLLEQVAVGNKRINGIALALNKSDKQIYRIVKKLKNFITNHRGVITAEKNTTASLLLNLLSKHSVLSDLLADSGIEILISLLEPRTVPEIMKHTGLKKSAVYKKLNKAYNVSIVRKNEQYFLNDKLWDDLIDFLAEMKKYDENVDERVPSGSTIYYKSKKEVVFSTKSIEKGTRTAFSAYGSYGITILNQVNYYVCPERRLTLKDVFIHSIYVAKKEKRINLFIYVILFYLKYKKELEIKDKLLENIKKILKGTKMEGFPTLKEVKEKAEIYDIEVRI